MPLKDSALVTLQEAQAYLGSGSDQNARLQDAINQASDAIEAYCQRALKARTFTAERVEGVTGPRLYPTFPLGWPIDLTKTITITVDGVAQTVWRSEDDGAPTAFTVVARSDHFFRASGWCSGNPYNVVLTFTGGYDPVPDDLKLACCYVLQRIFAGDQQHALTDVSSLSSPGGSMSFTPRGFVMPGQAADILQFYRTLSAA